MSVLGREAANLSASLSGGTYERWRIVPLAHPPVRFMDGFGQRRIASRTAPPEGSQDQTVKLSKPRDDSAGTPEANEVVRGRRIVVGLHGEDPAMRAVGPIAAAKQRSRSVQAPVPSEA